MACKHERVPDVEDVEAADTSSSDQETKSTATAKSECSGRLRRATPVLAAVVLIGAAVATGGRLVKTNRSSMKASDTVESGGIEEKAAEPVKDAMDEAMKKVAEDIAAGLMRIPTQSCIAYFTRNAVTDVELTEPPVVTADEPIILSLEETKLPTPWLGGWFWTRAYNGSVPGPTIRVKPGQTLSIKIENNLGPGPGYEACDKEYTDLGWFMNPATICALNHTNLHTHGLHTSPSGNGDNIWLHTKPGEHTDYDIVVPENHMGGTAWYHPHVHHGTAAQAGGGAHGALIVDDPPGSLPDFIEDMTEKLMFLSLVHPAKEMRMEAWGLSQSGMARDVEQYMWRNPQYPDWVWSPIGGTIAEHGQALGSDMGILPELVVNGQYRPKVTMEENKWYRFRFVFASIEQRAEVYPSPHKFNDAFCQYQLLAKDGIYLNMAPRSIERIYLASGSRADVAVSCSCSGRKRPCSSHIDYLALWQPMGVGKFAMTMEQTTAHLMRLEIVPGDEDTRGLKASWVWSAFHPVRTLVPLPKFRVRRPCYLVDLRTYQVPTEHRHTVELPQLYPMQITYDGHGQVWADKPPPPLANIKLGEIQEWSVSGVRYHPFHTHVNPFQIIEMWNDPYYLPGDWHDSLAPVGSDTVKVRMNPDRFTGHMIGHCHILEHEDNGMMAYWQLVGNEGDTWSEATMHDPQCFNGPFPGPPTPLAPVNWR